MQIQIPVYPLFQQEVKPQIKEFCWCCFGTGQYDDYQDYGDTMIYAGTYECPFCFEELNQ